MYCALGGGANKTNIKHFLNTSSYFKNHFTKSSRAIVNISIIASLALSQSLAAANLPSGGKFVNGTGSIATNGNTMNIAGDKTHNVIAWGGGFNIGKGNTVNFTTNSKNYLNLDYTNKASQILGTLNGGTNNIYLVNPSGVLVGEGATINANKFGASTTPMDINAINTFSKDGSFSPVFESNKGDIVNLGSIKANEIVLVGNKVENIKGKLQGKDQTFADTVTIKGDKVYLEDFGIDTTHLKAEIGSEGFFKYEIKDVYDAYKDDSNLADNYKFTGTATTNGNFKEYLYIGSQSANNEEMIDSWKVFANSVNEGIFGKLKFEDVYLGKDIDFTGAGAIDPVGINHTGFAGNFYGNNHTLSNIQIKVDNRVYAGLFGYITGGSFQDLRIDGLSFNNNLVGYAGGFAGYIKNGTFSNISLNNIENIDSQEVTGGFAGYIGDGTFSNISLNNIDSIRAEEDSGGFAGKIDNGIFDNISLKDLTTIEGGSLAATSPGGFAGYIGDGTFSNISLNNIDSIEAATYSGGFAGHVINGTFSNISLNNIAGIGARDYAGGFAGYVINGTFSNIDLSNIVNISSNWAAGGFSGWIDEGVFSNIGLNNIGAIKVDAIYAYAGGFSGAIKSGAFSSIILDNIESIVSNNTGKYTGYSSGALAGGFAGYITGEGTFENIILNNIGKISAATKYDDVYTNTGGFAGYINGGTFKNIVLNNIDDISGRNYVGGFAGWITKGNDISFSDVILNNIENISANATNENAYVGGFTGYADTGTYKNIILNNIEKISANSTIKNFIYAGGFAGRVKSGSINFSDIVLNNIRGISASDSTGGFVGNIENGSNITNSNIYFYGSLDSSSKKDYITYNENILNLSNSTDLQTLQTNSGISGLEYLTDTSTGNSYLHMVNNGYIGDANSKITFDKDNFTYNTPKIPEVNPDGSSSLPTVPDEGKLSSVTLDKSDFSVEILETIIDEILNENYVLNIDSIDFNKFNEGDVAILLYLLENTSDEKLKESLKQSLEFYTEFNKGGLKTEFEKWYGSDESAYKTSMSKYNYIVEGLANLKEYVKTTLKPELEAIKNNLNRLEFLKAEIARLEKVYQEAMQNNLLPYDQLKVVYKNTQEKIDAYYAEAQGLLDTLKNKNKPFLDDLITKKYAFNDKYTDIQGSFTIAGSSIDANAIKDLTDKPILSLPENENSGDDQTTNRTDSSDIIKTLAKQADLASDKSVIVLPAEETQNLIEEDERERGRVCIVSDNAKTNNPCIAIAF
ncbi:filamentous hemagglutinin N-terminal domain-containing protein [Campylobacter coli]|nr:filamentous hemagglutinin N-terminal domain-containing protein [Campylobacter coli]